MASADYEKSILSQVTLDSSKLNGNHQSETILPSLHAGELSYQNFKHKNSRRDKYKGLPFGSTANRIAHQLEPKRTTNIVSYVSTQSGQKGLDSIKHYPFGNSDQRFKSEPRSCLGPGLYEIEMEKKQTKKKPQILPIKRQRLTKDQVKEEINLGPGSYNLQNPSIQSNTREKIKEKFIQTKMKYRQFLGKARNHKQNLEPLVYVEKQGLSTHEKDDNTLKQSRQKFIADRANYLSRFLLKDSTENLVKIFQKESQFHETDRTCQINKNFTYNFIEKKDNPYTSYIPKITDDPGPGHYFWPKRNLAEPKQSSIFKSNSQRAAFKISNQSIKKQKQKLSWLL